MSPIDDSPQWSPDALAASHALTELIRTEIRAAGGLLPFDRFMELALYAPGLGYYVAGSPKIGPAGDFTTAPETSPLFGACIASQCAEAFERLGGGSILELGAGTGTLAIQVLQQLDALGAPPDEYLILEPSPELAERQRLRIAETTAGISRRVRWLDTLPQDLEGVILANEVIDAMPVHRFRIAENGETREVFVRDTPAGLEEAPAPVHSTGLSEAIASIRADGPALAPGYSSEVNLRLTPWIGALSQMLKRGLILLIDYGYPRAQYYQPDRGMGTLMCHLRHRTATDPYSHIGLQDITAHVDFSAAARAGIDAGLRLAGFTTQAHFLIGCGIDALIQSRSNRANRLPDLDLILGAKQLLLPSAMGERFKVLGLSKAIPGPWRGFAVRDLGDRLFGPADS